MSGNDVEVTKADSEEESYKSEAVEYDDRLVLNSECVQEEAIADSSVTTPAIKPKILVQRVFQQTENHVVEQKLDYVIANSEEEITKHIFGGLFRTKYYNYAPENYCKKHDPDLFEHQDETLVKLGDKFDSRESFRLYVDGYAKQWKYYLKCADSHRKDGKATFVFNCVFAKQRHKYSAAKGLRKRTFAVPRFACPCRIILKPVPFGAKDLTVIYVCNHHDHPLTDEYFQKLQHGRRLHPSVKSELMDLLSLEVDREVVKKYLESLTGYTMNDGFFNNMLTSMKKNKVERQFSLEKLKEMSKKVEKIKEELGMNDEENVDNDIIPEENIRKDKASQVAEVFNVLKAVSAPKRTPQKLRARRNPESGLTSSRKRQKKQQDVFDDPPLPSPQPVNNQSRLETRLQELKHDHETLQSVKHLQDSVRCETEHNPWVIEHFAETPNRTSVGSKPERGRNSHKHTPVTRPEIEPQAIVIENPTHDENYVENQEIVYENEITIMETGVENNPDSIVECVNVVNAEDIELNENNVSYCIQYEEDEQEAVAQPAEQQYVLLLDDVESFENLPEVQIQATELATVSIVSENNQKDANSDVTNANQYCNTTLEETTCQNEEIKHNTPEVPIILADNISVLNSLECDDPKNTEEVTLVYEVIQTNDKKIWPNKQVVDTLILNKVPKSKAPKSESINMSLKSKDKSGISKRRVKGITKDVTEEYMKDVFKKDLDKLGEDECFMIVVKDEERNRDGDNSSQDWMEDFDDYEIPPSRYKRVKYNDSELHEYDSEKSEENKNRLDSKKQVRHSSTKPYEDWLEELEDSKDSSSSSNRRERERELFELEEAVSELKQQKVLLERDIRRLVATKDNLIEDITKTKARAKTRLTTRAFKWRVPR